MAGERKGQRGQGPGRFSDEAIATIHERVDLVNLVGQSVALKRQGSAYVGLCPFHPEKSPSFHVHPERPAWFYCFGCQAKGDAFTFLMKRDGLTFPEAVERLASETGVEIRSESPAEQKARLRREQVLAVLARAASLYREGLRRAPWAESARAYLERRGISPASQERFGIGASHPVDNRWLTRLLCQEGVEGSLLEEAGLVLTRNGDLLDRFQGRVLFPIQSERGQVIAFGARRIREEDWGPKYLNSPETATFRKRETWYGLYHSAAVLAQSGAVLVEGYMDVIACHQAGLQGAIASLGTALTETHATALARRTKQAVLLLDQDEAGVRAAKRALPLLLRSGLTVRLARLPAGKDPDECLQMAGAEALQRAVREAAPAVEALLPEEAEHLPPEAKGERIRELLPVLAAIPSPVEQAAYLERVAARFGVPLRAVEAELRGERRTVRTTTGEHALPSGELEKKGHTNERNWNPTRKKGGFRPQGLRDGVQRAERELLSLIYQYPKRGAAVKAEFIPEDFLDPLARSVARVLWAGESVESGGFGEAGKDAESLLAAMSGKSDEEAELLIDGYQRRLREARRERRIAELQEMLKTKPDQELVNEYTTLLRQRGRGERG